MEKRVILSLALIILVSLNLVSFVYAQNEDVGIVPLEEKETAEEKDVDIPTDITEGIEGVKDIKTKTEQTLEQDVIVPEKLQIPARIIFGVQGEIPLQIFIILVGIWIVLFILIASILKLTPFFEGFKAWIGGAVITCLIAITGTIRSLAVFFFNIGNVFSFLEKWSVLKIVVALVIIGVLFYGLSIVMKILNEKLINERAEMAGVKGGAGLKMGAEAFEQMTKK